MNYLFSIQIENEQQIYINKIDNYILAHEQIEHNLQKYFGEFCAMNSDEDQLFNFSITLQENVKLNDLSYRNIQLDDIDVSISTNSNYSVNKDTIIDQLKYWILSETKEKTDSDIDGIEADEANIDNSELNPYNPELIRVDPRQMPISYLHELINEYSSLELTADFQRNFVWTDAKRKSRLIESILLRIPLPAFYFSTDSVGNYEIVDGLQRVNVINMFINGEFKLTDLEYLKDCENQFFSLKYDKSNSVKKRTYLDPKYVRRILETQLIINVIDPQTPSKVKYDVFKRLNTGGKPLTNMEIRNSFATKRIRMFLRELTYTQEYRNSSLTTVNSTRFADIELILRFIAFYNGMILKNSIFAYKGNMDSYLDDVIEYLKTTSERDLINLQNVFCKMLKLSSIMFGRYAFRKVFSNVTSGRYRMPLINKSLFTAMSIMLIKYYNSLIEISSMDITKNVELLSKKFESNYRFYESMSYGTNDKDRVNSVFAYTEEYIKELLAVYND